MYFVRVTYLPNSGLHSSFDFLERLTQAAEDLGGSQSGGFATASARIGVRALFFEFGDRVTAQRFKNIANVIVQARPDISPLGVVVLDESKEQTG